MTVSKSAAEETLALFLDDEGICYVRDYQFCQRKWRADFAFPEVRLLVEVEGGVWTRGRHVRGQGFINDCMKYNTATLLGWRVLRFTTGMVDDGTALRMIERALESTALGILGTESGEAGRRSVGAARRGSREDTIRRGRR